MANDIILLVIASVLVGLAFAFLLAFILGLIMYFRKTKHVSDLEVLKRKWTTIAKLQFAGQFNNIWISGVPYIEKLQTTIRDLNKTLAITEVKTDEKYGVPAIVYNKDKLEDISGKLDELNGRLRTNMRGIPLGEIIGYTVLDIQSDLDFAYELARERGKNGIYVLRTPGGKTVVLDENKIQTLRNEVRRYGTSIHLFLFEKTYGFSIPFIYSNKSTQLLIAYPDQFDIFGSDVCLRGAGLNSFAGILYLTGYANREIPEVTAIIHASYANLVENVVGAGSEIANKAIGMDTTATKIMASNIASHPTSVRPEK